MGFRIGHGFDAHRLEAGRPLMLGGIPIPYERGLLGHPTATASSTLCDALLGRQP